MALYLFLVLAADRNGVSFYRKEKICDAILLDFNQFEIARDRLINLKLIDFKAYTVLSPNGHYQILPIKAIAPNFADEIIQNVTQQLGNKSNLSIKGKRSGYEQRTSP